MVGLQQVFACPVILTLMQGTPVDPADQTPPPLHPLHCITKPWNPV